MPRLIRSVLLLTSLSLLLLPSTGTVGANPQDPPDLVGGTVASGVASCSLPLSSSHERCAGGVIFAGNIVVAAKRADNSATAACTGDFAAIDITARETMAEGRGRVGPNQIDLDENGGVDNCSVRLEGRYHRIGTVAIGRLTIDVHRADATFRHSYCARFIATADPMNGVRVKIEGFETPACAGGDPDSDGSHGRRADDGHDLVHHDTCVDEVGLSCSHVTPTRVL